MQLINLLSATYTAFDGWLDLSIEADLGNGTVTIPFTYAPGDANGLGPQVAAWLAANPGFPIGDYAPPPDPDPMPLKPEVYAVANLGINAGEISGIETAAKFSAAMYFDVGYYLLFFTETQPDTSCLAKAYDDATRVRVTEKGTDYIAVTVTDNADPPNPVDPSEISVEIIRVI